jgi:peptidoglycan/xylan/chitin deacetylase (PgdA/CDA1 family)
LLKETIQTIVRQTHFRVMSRALPSRVAVCCHSLAREFWPSLTEMVRYFRGQGYRFVGPEELLVERVDRVVFLSFDDNFRSWWQALPLLARLDLPATFYVNTAPLSDRADEGEVSAYFDRIGARSDRASLSSGELREIAAAGHVIGSHSHTHRRLTGLTDAEARLDIEVGKRTLEDVLGREVPHFSYPFGMRRHFSEPLRRYCRHLGHRTIAEAAPGMQFAGQSADHIRRSTWLLDRSLDYNLRNLRVDGRLFERVTGRSAVA